MNLARLHWNILYTMERDFTDKIREFMVIGKEGEGVLMVTEPDGEGFWFGKMRFGRNLREATKPTQLGVSNLVKMAQGNKHIVLLDGRGKIYILGINNRNQLGLGTADERIRFTPQLIDSPERFINVRCGYGHSLALTEDGSVLVWEDNFKCQVGYSCLSLCLRKIIDSQDFDRVVAIECGGWHSLALTDQGQVYGWGSNGSKQISDLLPQTYDPVLLTRAHHIIQIAAGYCHTLLLTNEGLVFACGLNNYGQLGQPTSDWTSSCLNDQVFGLPPILQISSHFATHLSIALSQDGRCFVWGEWNRARCPIPIQLSPTFSTIESPLSCSSTQNMSHSVRVTKN